MTTVFSRLDIAHEFCRNIKVFDIGRFSFGPGTDDENSDYSYVYYNSDDRKIYRHYRNDAEADKPISVRALLKIIRAEFDRYPQVFVNAYAVSRHFGGPEEGGWYYDVGEPLETISVLKRPGYVEAAKKFLKEKYAEDFERNHTRYSVLGGDDLEIYVEEHPAERWPTQRPHYE